MVGKGKLLIAEPFLGDPNFERSVILLCEDDENGTLGLVLNKPSALKVNDVLEDMNEFNQPLYIGGPVDQDCVNFIYTGINVVDDSVEISDGVFMGGDFDQLFELARFGKVNPDNFRFFLGYSGWDVNQLTMEMNEKTWIVGNTSLHEVLLMAPPLMWHNILKSMGGKYKMYSNYPIDPRLN